MKAWALGQQVNEEDLAKFSEWITFPDLNFKYWSKGLSKIGCLIGCLLATDKATRNKNRARCSRLLIDIDLNQAFLDEVTYG